MKQIITATSVKNQAKLLADYLASIKRKVTHGNALEAVAHMYGKNSWNVLSAELEASPAECLVEQKAHPAVPEAFFAQQHGMRVELKVRSDAWSDDRREVVEFDAAPWFFRATDKEILGLQSIDWSRDLEADAVAQDLAYSGLNEDLKEMLDYVGRNEDIGYEVAVEEDDAMKYCRAFRYPLFVQLMLTGEFGGLEPKDSKEQIFVYEDSDQQGKWVFYLDGLGSDISYDSRDEAYAALGEQLEGRFPDWDDATNCDLDDVLSVVPGSGEYVGQVESQMPAVSADSGAVPGRDLNYVANRGAVLVMKPGDEPLSRKTLRHITNDCEFGLRVAIPVGFDQLIECGGIDGLNNLAEESIASEGLLSNLRFERYAPENEANLVDTKDVVYVLVSAEWEPTDDLDDEEDGDGSDIRDDDDDIITD